MRQIVLDTETTGLDPKTGHRIIEIGALELDDGILTGRKFHVYVNPEREVPEEAYKIHGISTQFLQDKPKFSEIVDDFLSFIIEAELVIHNAQFDMKFINHELMLLNKPSLDSISIVDTLFMARKKFPGSPANLDALCKRFKINNSDRVFHGALLDAKLLADVYIELCGGRQIKFESLESVDQEIVASQKTNIGVKAPSEKIATKIISPSEQELEDHQKFIKNLKDPIW